jgi:hypothetical protein
LLRAMFRRFLVSTVCLAIACSSAVAERLIGEGDSWRYYKGSSTPPMQSGVNWTQLAFSDSGWGTALRSGFGYGDGDDANDALGDMQNNYFSVFLRRNFTVENPATITRLTLAADYDDGFVAYINGVEVARRNMPAGPIAHNTPASSAHEASRGGGAENPQEKEFIEIDPARLVAGNNVLAISAHNSSLGSTDLTIVPELYTNVTLVRGPYLQMPVAGQMSVVWRTDALTDSAVDYGTDTNYTSGTVTDSALVRQHIVTLPVLPAGTTLHYRVRSGGVTLAESSFHAPRAADQPFRFAVYGDFGWSDAPGVMAHAPTVAVANQVAAADPHFTLTVGDNIYNDGQPGMYDPSWFVPYNAINRRAPLFPALGNHDVNNSANGLYYSDNFYLRQNGPSGLQERSYSFDYGNAHIAVVDSNPFVYKVDTAQQAAIKSWLAADLAATTQLWKFVVFHHPAYTSSGTGVHSPATIMQTEISSLCEQHGVQLVFQGHNHFYERINPIRGVHYITTGGGGRSLYSPNVIAEYSAARNPSVHNFTRVEIDGGLLTLREIDTTGAQIDALTLKLEHPFKIDGLLDSPDYLRAQNGLRLYAAIRGRFLYVATQDAGEGSDHFIYLNDQSAPMRAANWTKAGEVMSWGAFLADENQNGFHGWYNGAASPQLLTNADAYLQTTSGLNNNAPTGDGVLEGTIDLATHFGAWPQQLYLAAAPFGSADGGALVSNAQVPAGNSDGSIQPTEFLVLNPRDIALDLPTSDAGGDQSVEAGMMVTLSGNGAAPSGLPMSLTWAQLAGPAVTINAPSSATATFTPPANVAENTPITLRLRVNDTRFDTDDTVLVTLFPMVDSDDDGLSDQEELTGKNNSLTAADPTGRTTDPNLADSDGDGMNDGDEALAGTDANSAASAFKIVAAEASGRSITLVWSSVPGRSYQVERTSNLGSAWIAAGDAIVASESTNSMTVTGSGAAEFFRVRLLP